MEQEVLIATPVAYSFNEWDGSDGKTPVKIPCSFYGMYEVGDITFSDAAAPGTGRIVHRVTRKDETGLYGVVVENTIREMEPWEVM